MPTINPERLLETLHTLRTFGATASGVVRPSFSAVDMAARHWLCEQMAAAGLAASIDGVGNVIGRSRQRGKAYLQRDWDEAARLYAQMRAQCPEDGVAARLHERIEAWRSDPALAAEDGSASLDKL